MRYFVNDVSISLGTHKNISERQSAYKSPFCEERKINLQVFEGLNCGRLVNMSSDSFRPRPPHNIEL